ncbi:MAG TPA: hypothetical protein VF773_19460 [Verrucomicrobiae bacterium]
MNSFIGFYDDRVKMGGALYRKTSEVAAPSERFIFIDEHEDSIILGQFISRNINWLTKGWEDLPGARHGTAGTLSFADGHAEIRKWIDPRTRQPVLRKRQFGQLTGAGGNEDVLWLWLRTTTPEPAYMP